ncbi:hypothetical protein [Ruminococcus sp.]|uniref:hypothetical protein n=1 Tax=Ruminococcus sp. TaxID=41978 RepID=UPI0025FA9E34|nr:hypothetical protein [Ruminococcus sp.]MBQ8965904.1 hypothetical protein [Ruminococcus sp.]
MVRLMDEKYGVFFIEEVRFYFEERLWNGPYYKGNSLIASDMAGEYIEKQTGVAPDPEGITVYLPKEHTKIQVNAVKEWLRGSDEENNNNVKITWKDYDRALIMGSQFFPHDRVGATLAVNIADSPIIIYYAHSADFEYFNKHDFFTAADRNAAEAVRKKNMLLAVKSRSIPCSSLIRDYKRKTSSVSVIFVLIMLSVGVYYLTIVVSTLSLDINIRKRERAVRKILGRPALSRYAGLAAAFAGTLAASSAAAFFLKKKIPFSRTNMFIAAVAALVVLEAAAVFIAAKLDEKRNTQQELKGGAL